MKAWPWAAGAAAAGVLVVGVLMPNSAPPLPALDLSGQQSTCEPGGPVTPIKAGSGALSGAEVAKVAHGAGFRGADLVIAVAVAKAESGWAPSALNDNTNASVDHGLFQINSVHTAILAAGTWSDPNDNAVMAHQIWLDAGSSWSPWVTYWRGTYRQHMSEATAAVAALNGTVQVTGCDVAAGDVVDPGTGRQGADGLTPRAQAVKATTLQKWGCKRKADPCIAYIGGYAKRNIAGTNTPSDHSTGNADDIMLGSDYRSQAKNAMGWEIARFWQANAKVAGIKYIIFDAKIWSPGDKNWRAYQHPGGGGDTLMHIDHVHVSVLG